MARAKAAPFRLFNLRVLPLFAAGLILGIFCVKLNVWIAATLLGAMILFVFLLFKTKSIGKGLALALCLALLGGYTLAGVTLYCRNSVGITGDRTLTCRVTEVTESDDAFSVRADRIHTDGKWVFGGIALETEESVAVGDRLTVKGEVSIRTLSLDSFQSALSYRKGAKYEITPESLTAEQGAPPFRYLAREKVRSLLLAAQGDRAGAFSYAMLFGDTEYMEDSDKTAMREVGVAHVVAVSGLHVGVLCAVILFLLNKLRVRKKARPFILLPILGFYAYLAGFTPSVLRASIMALVALTASALGERYDDISSLSLAAILILLIRPLYLFDLSFVMSFLAIFGIAALGNPLEKAFLRHKVPPRLASALALSFATTLSLIPLSAVVFGRIALAGFALNLIVVPLASAAFVLNLVALLPTLVFPSFGAVLSLFGYLPELIAEISVATAALGFAANYAFSTVEILLYYGTIAFTSKYSLSKRSVKLLAAGVGGSVLLILLLV